MTWTPDVWPPKEDDALLLTNPPEKERFVRKIYKAGADAGMKALMKEIESMLFPAGFWNSGLSHYGIPRDKFNELKKQILGEVT